MKTRVVRYWHGTDWHHKVEVYDMCEKDELLYSFGSGGAMVTTTCKTGTWYWKFVAAGLTRSKAEEIALKVTNQQPYDILDVVYEAGWEPRLRDDV